MRRGRKYCIRGEGRKGGLEEGEISKSSLYVGD
jgi:hypothetical protein